MTAIDLDADMIQVAGRFGFKVYYGDGTRLDVLRAAGADNARLVAICIDDEQKVSRIVDLVRGEVNAAIEAGLLNPADPEWDSWFLAELARSVFHYYGLARRTLTASWSLSRNGCGSSA